MRFHIVVRYVGFVLLINAFFLFLSFLISLFNSDDAFFPLLYSFLITALFGVFPLIFVSPAKQISNKEGVMIVVSGWILSCFVGTLPYLLEGGEFTLSNAWFESVSGYTTTGSSIISNVEALPSGLLFWRSATHWIGGMGIIIFVLTLLPSLGNVGLVLYRSEMSSLAQENFRQRATRAVQILLAVYISLTVLETVALLLCGMSFFDAITHSFATIATGGFSPKNESIAHYQNVSIEIVVIIFMILSGIHFGLLFSIISANGRNLWKSIVVRYYIIVLLIGVIISTINIHGDHFRSWLHSLRLAAFQIVSIGTSTGFATTDTAVLPSLTQILIIFFALQCACAGSTSGGIKVDRMIILGKVLSRRIKQLLHPHAVITVRVGERSLKTDVIEISVLFIVVYLGIVFLSTLSLVSLGVDPLSAFSGTVATMGNVGPGLGAVGSMSNFSGIPDPGKWILTITMLAGRLEIFSFVIFFIPKQWK